MSLRESDSLSALLTRMNLVVSGAALLMAGLAFFSYDLLSLRHALIRDLAAEAQIIGDNTVSALTLNDKKSAAITLNDLRRSPDVLAAALDSSNGTPFALYRTPDQGEAASHLLSVRETDHIWSSGTHVLLAHRVISHGQPVGILYISARLAEIGQRARECFLIVCVILLFCMAAALAISSISRRLIAQPIIALADTALLVSRGQDYSVRAGFQADSHEITVLIDAFNTMLTQIQDRDAALNEARSNLEARVEERTAELQAANRELESFSHTVAHDLRGPLDSIDGIIFLLKQSRGDVGGPDIQSMLDQFKTTTANMGSLIDDLLNFARASTVPVKSTPVDLSALAREIAGELTRSGPTRKVRFQIEDVPKAFADTSLMRIVLDNLLRNSWKYTSHHARACIEFGAKQTLSADQALGKLVYFVRDDGAGFDQSHTSRLFQPFERLHSKGDFPGTGIGLATVSRILARQGGFIWAEGCVEKGATFYFTLNSD